MIRIVVVLPAPFAPRKPRIPPGCTVKLTPSSAWTSPKRFVTPSISSAIVLPHRETQRHPAAIWLDLTLTGR